MRKLFFYFLCAGCLLFVTGVYGSSSVQDAFSSDEPRISKQDAELWSSWTPAQRIYYARMARLVAEHGKRDDRGAMALDLSQAEFLKTGLPDSVYTKAALDLENYNRGLPSLNLPQEQLVEMADDYFKEMKRFVVNFDAFCKSKGYSLD